jgi:hypothetical protein
MVHVCEAGDGCKTPSAGYLRFCLWHVCMWLSHDDEEMAEHASWDYLIRWETEQAQNKEVLACLR